VKVAQAQSPQPILKGSNRMSMDIKPHAYDPAGNPELFEGVLARRIVAFMIDFIVIALPIVLGSMFIFAFGIVTLGLGWALYWLLPGASVIWAIAYFGLTLGGPRSATIGMRVMDLEMRTWYGAPAYFVLGAVHAIGFWFTVSFFTPFILLVAFFNERRRLLHDIVLGTVIINNAQRAAMLRSFMPASNAESAAKGFDGGLAERDAMGESCGARLKWRPD
jgi:uncharacterized RDD family membrane protein YckC